MIAPATHPVSILDSQRALDKLAVAFETRLLEVVSHGVPARCPKTGAVVVDSNGAVVFRPPPVGYFRVAMGWLKDNGYRPLKTSDVQRVLFESVRARRAILEQQGEGEPGDYDSWTV
jgi:hypothetical protein